MDHKEPTYADLFNLLRSLEFSEHTTGASRKIFEHAATDTVLLFSVATQDQTVRDADYVSAQVHLLAKGLIGGPLEILLRREPL